MSGTAASAATPAGVTTAAPGDAAAGPPGPATPAVTASPAAAAPASDAASTRPDAAAALHAAARPTQAPSGRLAGPAPASPGGVARPASSVSLPGQAALPAATPDGDALPPLAVAAHAGAAASSPGRHLPADTTSGATPSDAASFQTGALAAGTFQTADAQNPAVASPTVQSDAAALASAAAGPGPTLPPTEPTGSAAPSRELPASVAAQVVPAVLAMHSANGAQNMMLRLTPAELGTVQVQITREHDGTASVSVLVERPETLRLLLHDQAQLQHALSQAGLPQDRTLSLEQAPPGSFASQEHAASTRDPGQGAAGGGPGADPGQAGREGGARQGSAQNQDARSGSGRASPGLRSYASAWQPAGIDITA
ncbi:MAG: flagellar hook-length control protein FliK [Janthinobacterium lividum]